jgi:hypothetical protein
LQIIGVALTEHQAGIRLPHVILDDDGGVVGRATLNEIVLGPFNPRAWVTTWTDVATVADSPAARPLRWFRSLSAITRP